MEWVNGALKLLTDNIRSGSPREHSPVILIQGPTRPIHPVAYDDMDESVINKASMLTKGGSGPSGLDGSGWCRILTSRAFGTVTSDLAKHLPN